MTNFDKLRILGEALHGPRWMRAAARDLGVNYRTVLRWGAGEGEPSAGHIAEMIAAARKRSINLQHALKRAT